LTLRLDSENRTLEVSVGDLVLGDPLLRSRGATGRSLPDRMAMGTRAHQNVQQVRAGHIPGYESEIQVRREFGISGWTVTVQGRVDGLHRDENGILVLEEIKSVTLPPSRFTADGIRPRSEHLLQLEIYCALLAEGDEEVRGLLILFNLADDATLELPVELDAPEARRRLEARLDALLTQVEEERQRLETRTSWADQLVFPFPAMRPGQDELVAAMTGAWEKGHDILASAPAGTGKTAASIWAALQHALANRLGLFFVTAKTTQQKLAAETLEAVATSSEIPLRSLVLRAKDAMCLCETRICHEEVCPHIREYPERAANSDIYHRLLDRPLATPERIRELSAEAGICPFEVSLDLCGMVDAVVCDYNYVFDPAVALRRFSEGANRDTLLVIDEAHNLLERGRDYYSPSLERNDLAALFPFLTAGRSRSHRRLESLFAELEALVEDVSRGAGDQSDPLETLVEFDPAPLGALRDRLDSALVLYLLESQARGGTSPDDPVLRFAADFGRFANTAQLGGDEFVRIFRRREDNSEQLKILCLDPGRQLGRRIRSFGGTAAMSATLQPVSYYRQVLGFRKTKTDTAAFPSPFPNRNRLALVVPSVSTLYRDRPANYDPIARIIERATATHPSNHLVFFPSFAFLRQVSRRLHTPGYTVIRQEPEMSLEQRANVIDSLAAGKAPHLVLAVQGGIFAEGVDYPGDMASGVIVVGPGLPQVCFERELIKRHFQETDGKGFEFAFLYPGMNRAVQAAGRLIRTPEDRGVILLLGRRFASARYSDLFPAHWYDISPREMIRRDWPELIERFRADPELDFGE
jgi:DNA excision repair protein ERCC-2